jgi:hypothetical protein
MGNPRPSALPAIGIEKQHEFPQVFASEVPTRILVQIVLIRNFIPLFWFEVYLKEDFYRRIDMLA